MFILFILVLVFVWLHCILATNDFPPNSFPPNGFPASPAPFASISIPPAHPPSSTPPASILQQNTACCLLLSALSTCTSLTPKFTALPPTQQASCLCYSSTAYCPQIFDNAVKSCAAYASTAAPAAYSPIFNLESFCANIGPQGYGQMGPATTITECDPVSSFLAACEESSTSFFQLQSTDQASCLCYVSSTWMPTGFDNAVQTCMQAAKTGNTAVYGAITSLEGFCEGVGNVITGTNGDNDAGPTGMATSAATTGSGTGTGTGVGGRKTGMTTTTDLTLTVGVGGSKPTDNAGGKPQKNDTGLTRVSLGELIGICLMGSVVLFFLC